MGTEAAWFRVAFVVTVADLPAARMNEPDAPPTLLPAAVVEIVTLAGAVPLALTVAENFTCVRMTFTRCFLPLIRFVTNVVSFFLVMVCLIWVGTWRIDCVSTLPAALGTPTRGVYGVHSDVQR